MKRILSVILALVLVINTVPMGALSAENGVSAEANEISIEAGNALGELISEEITAYQDAQLSAEEEYEPGFSVTDLVFKGATATVTYDAMEEATLVVAVYTEDGLTLVNSAYRTVSPDATTAAVTISGTMPEYFYAAAYLLDTYDLSPLCADYSTPVYTRAMQELLASTVNDYPADRVLKLEESNTTNFAVYEESTVIVERQAGVNTVASANDETMRYVIENADETFTALVPGAVVAYEYGDRQYIFAKVATIDVSGTTVTIQGAEIEMEDVFSHVKLEGSGDMGDATIDTSTASEFLRYIGNSGTAPSSFTDGSLEGSLYKEFAYADGVLSSKLTVGLDVMYSFLVADDIMYTKLSIGLTVGVEASVGRKFTLPIPMGKWYLPIASGVITLTFEPKVELEFSVKMNFTGTFSTCIGFQYNTIAGFAPIQSTPSLKTEISVEGTVFIGADLHPSILLCMGFLGQINASLPAGVEITAKESLAEKDHLEQPKEDPDERHSCEICLEIKSYFKVDFKVGFHLMSIVKKEFHVAGLKIALADAYYSVDEDEFGWGKCPYKEYKVTVLVRDGENAPVGGATVQTSSGGKEGDFGMTNGGGICSVWLAEGSHTIVAKHGEQQKTVTEKVKEPKKVTIKLPKTEDEEPEETEPPFPGGIMGDVESTPVAAPARLSRYGYLSNGMYFQYYSSEYFEYSRLVITGSGEVNSSHIQSYWEVDEYGVVSGPHDNDGWGDSFPAIGHIVFGEGITAITATFSGAGRVTLPSTLKVIGTNTFAQGEFTSISLPAGLETIGEGAFYQCRNLKSVVIPGSVREMGISVFYSCSSLTQAVVSEGVTELPEGTFGNCGSLRSLQLPNTLETIGSVVVRSSGLKEITIPGSVKNWGRGAFAESNLQKVTCLPGLESIGEWAFGSCPLISIDLPESLKEIGALAFHDCYLTSVIIPKSVEYIGQQAFSNCSQLTDVTFGGFDLSDGRDYGLTIGSAAFEQTKVTSLELPALDSAWGSVTLKEFPWSYVWPIDTIVLDGCIYELHDLAEEGNGWGGMPFDNHLGTIYYPYAYSEMTLPEDDVAAAEYYYTADRMQWMGHKATWVPYTVDEYGNMVPDESFAWCPETDGWENRPMKPSEEDTQASGSAVVETMPEETIPEETVTETLPAETAEATVPQETIVNIITEAAAETVPQETVAETVPMETVEATEPLTLVGMFFRLPRFLTAAPTALAEEVLGLLLTEDAEPAVTEAAETAPIETVVMETVPDETVVMETIPEETLEATEPDYDAIFGGEYGSEDMGEYILTTASFSGLVPGQQYVLLALTSTEDPLSHLVHIDQGTASASGTLSFDYVEGAVTASYVMACGASNQNLNDASITLPVLYANGEEQVIEPTVVYGGRILEEGVDYTLSGKVSFTEPGEYTCYIRGIYNYTGTVKCVYTVEESPYAEPPVVEKPRAESVKLYENGTDLSAQKIWVKKLTEEQVKGFSVTLTAEVLPEEAEQYVTWFSSDSQIATVSRGTVSFTGTAGEVTITAETENDLAASVTYRIELPTQMQPVGGTEVNLMAGKATTLKITNSDTGKAVAARDIRWTIDDPSVATITAAGRLTAKKLPVQTATTLTAEISSKGEYVDTVTYRVTVYPAATQVEILDEQGEVLNGKTIPVDTGDGVGACDLKAQVHPLDAMGGVTWKSSSKAIAEIDPDTGDLTWKGKNGTVTITATARDGSNKKATVKLVYGILADKVRIGVKDGKNIAQGEEWTLVSGKAVQLAAEVTAYEGKVTNQKLTWTADAPCVKVSNTGRVTAQTVYENSTATITATAVDSGKIWDTFTVHVQPKDPGLLTLRKGLANVTGSTLYVDRNQSSMMILMAKYLDGSSGQEVTWKSSNKAVAEVISGRVSFKKAGSVTITATDGNKKKATVTLKILELTKTVTITGDTEVASGKGINLKAFNEKGAAVKVDWSIAEGNGYAKIAASGKLTANKDITLAQTVRVQARAKDGSGITGEYTVTIRPIAQGVQILRQGRNLTDSTLEWAMNESDTLQLSAFVYPYYGTDNAGSAIQGISWKSSSTKTATVDENGLVTCLKPGTVTITATAQDGSNKKACFKLKVVNKIKGLSMEDQTVTGGKSLNLAKLIRIDPGDATNKTLLWEVTGGDGAQYVTLNAKTGALKTKKVPQPQTVTIRATAQDGSGKTVTFMVNIV